MDPARIRREVTNPATGFALVRGFYSSDEVDWYRERADALLASGPVMHAQIVHDRRRDYVFPRAMERVLEGYQVYTPQAPVDLSRLGLTVARPGSD